VAQREPSALQTILERRQKQALPREPQQRPEQQTMSRAVRRQLARREPPPPKVRQPPKLLDQ